MSATRRIGMVLFALGLGSLAVALWDVTTGGFYFTLGGVRLSSWEVYKPFRNGMVAMVAALWLHDRVAERHKTTWHILPRWASWSRIVAPDPLTDRRGDRRSALRF